MISFTICFPIKTHLVSVTTDVTHRNTKADIRNQNGCVLSRHSGMPLAGIHSAVFLDSGWNRAGMTEGEAGKGRMAIFSCFS
jgi:hypothetical protein